MYNVYTTTYMYIKHNNNELRKMSKVDMCDDATVAANQGYIIHPYNRIILPRKCLTSNKKCPDKEVCIIVVVYDMYKIYSH